MMVLVVILAVVAILIVMVVGTYNRLVGLRQNANSAFADIDVQLKQRQDLVPNLVETVKGYAAHERGTFDEVTAARAQAASATTVESKVAAENALSGALGRLFAVAEAYPELKANQNFLQLQGQLGDLENKLAAARRFFNNARWASSTPRSRPFRRSSSPPLWALLQRTFFDLGAMICRRHRERA